MTYYWLREPLLTVWLGTLYQNNSISSVSIALIGDFIYQVLHQVKAISTFHQSLRWRRYASPGSESRRSVYYGEIDGLFFPGEMDFDFAPLSTVIAVPDDISANFGGRQSQVSDYAGGDRPVSQHLP